ncbi:MAG: hypothetical protein JWQ87_5458 [Candidatus Sulfotelmatobacter sp.]|nr:hypothetical protein [Candidatus Sulfotelmatobacter sp.]
MIALRDPAVGKRAALSSIYESGGLQVVFDLMEDQCTATENELIGEVPWSESIVARQAIAHAQRAFFIAIAEAIDFHVAEARQTEVQSSTEKREAAKK